jgi:hypothetical protein
MENETMLKSTNEFALLGLKFLYFSNAGAIIAILVNVNNFVDEEDYPTIATALSTFIWGLLFALLSSFLGYLMNRAILNAAQNHTAAKWECAFGGLALCAAIASFCFFAYGAHQAIAIIEYAL